NASGYGAIDRIAGEREISVIEKVEALPPELEALGFREDEILAECRVDGHQPGTANDVRAGVPKAAALRRGKRGRVIPAFAVGFGNVIVADDVGSLAEIGVERGAVAQHGCEGEAGLQRGNAVDLPSGESDLANARSA